MLNLRGDEVLLVLGVAENGSPSGEQEYCTTMDIANLAGGGGLNQSQTINAGSVATAAIGDIVGWNSASGLAKTLNAPAATGSLGIIESVDLFGDAFDNPITFVPAGGSIVAGNQNQIYTNGGSARWRDFAPGIWVNV